MNLAPIGLGPMIVTRPDLSLRTSLSKSALGTFDLCQHKSWFGIHDPRPFVPNEKVTFGSAVDAGVEVLVKDRSNGHAPDIARAFAAAAEVIQRDDVDVVFSDVERAIEVFLYVVDPDIDFRGAVTQANVTAELEGLGECNGHPDIIMADGSVFDVKTSSRAKEVPSLELGFYALLMEAASALPVPTVGYMTWVRIKRPYWQIASVPVSLELRRWAYEKAAAFIRAKKADTALNAKSDRPANYSFPGSAKFPKLCGDCPWGPALGGPCQVAFQEASDDDAAD